MSFDIGKTFEKCKEGVKRMIGRVDLSDAVEGPVISSKIDLRKIKFNKISKEKKEYFFHLRWAGCLDKLLLAYLIEKYGNLSEKITMENVDEGSLDQIDKTYKKLGVNENRKRYGERDDKMMSLKYAQKIKLFENHPETENLVRLVAKIDKNINNGLFTFDQVIKNIYHIFGENEAICLARKVFDARIERNKELYYSKEIKEAYKNIQREEIWYDGDNTGIIIHQTNIKKYISIAPYAFLQGNVCVVVIDINNKNIQIIANRGKEISLKYVYREICKLEADHLDKWFYENNYILTNGFGNNDIEATNINITKILEIIKKYIY